MRRMVELTPNDVMPNWTGAGAVTPLEDTVRGRHRPAAHFAALNDSTLVARCSIWSADTPKLDGRSVGVIGHYAAADATAGTTVLRHAAQRLAEQGFAMAVGPMDGNTWRRYRLVTQRGTEAPFFLEPDNPDEWPDHFLAGGFTPLAEYCSGLNTDLTVADPRTSDAMIRLAAAGVTLRNIDMDRFEQDLALVHALSLVAFADNFLYTPIGREGFLGMYAPLCEHLRPELVLLAERSGQLVGFIFGLPDLKQAERGQTMDTVIAKSMAVHPDHAGQGLGGVLMDRFQQSARSLGYRRVIHAMMHENNRSRKITTHFGSIIRRYALYSKVLRP